MTAGRLDVGSDDRSGTEKSAAIVLNEKIERASGFAR